ncbi:hypothetical protein LSM04_007358 [Trypanosoma melophagium]|uniref:uncharacterized protein n=1 Tax=Trypanosoma melophagium TaxID=715481 RepID=UPI00351A7B94|nr:hypothetical protein LSM04_007358 [Trypanosoma melophagium]
MAALPVDFYLPPPDDRAYRRDKIQRLRDQITAWRRNANRGDHTISKIPTIPPNTTTKSIQSTQLLTAAITTAAELPRWRSAAVSHTRMCTSRHEKLFLQSCVTENWQREKRSGESHKRTLLTLGLSNTTNTIASRVLEVPYFHDQAIFCVPTDPANTADHPSQYKEEEEYKGNKEKENNEKEDKEGRGRAVDVWYGVTSNSEESGRQLESGAVNDGSVHNTVRNTGNNSSHDHSNSNNNKYNPNSSYPNNKSTLVDTPGRGSNVIESFFAVKLQSMDLAVSVHEERMRRKSIMRQRQRRESVKHQKSEEMFSKTMEIPIHWDEYRRLSPDGTTQRAKTATPSPPITSMPSRPLNSNTNINNNNSNSNNNNTITNKTVAVTQSNNSTSGTLYSHAIHSGYTHGGSTNAAMGDVENTRSGIRPHTTGPHNRPPLRLYAIRVNRKVTNSETSLMRSAETAPRLGTRVVLPKSWMN